MLRHRFTMLLTGYAGRWGAERGSPPVVPQVGACGIMSWAARTTVTASYGFARAEAALITGKGVDQ
jgi:hypothetical protein